MLKNLFALILIAALVAGAWYVSHTLRSEGDLEATIMFDGRQSVRKGASVTLDGVTIGEVTTSTAVGRNSAVVVRIDSESRQLLHSDSAFEVEGGGIVVSNHLAVGPPLESGAIVVARQDKLTRLLAEGQEKLGPAIDSARELFGDLDADRLDQQLDELAKKVPGWKAQGKETFERNMNALEKQVDIMEEGLRKMSRNVDADKLRETFDRWVAKVRQD